MISKKTSLAITALVLAASGAQAAFVNSEPTLTTIPIEAGKSSIASLTDPLTLTPPASAPVVSEKVAWSPICEVMAAQGAMGGVGGFFWDLYGCN